MPLAILSEFDRVPPAMREEAYVFKIVMLRDKLLRLKKIYRRKDAELTELKSLVDAFNMEREDHYHTLQELDAVQKNLHEQTARTAELERINHQLWSHVERFHQAAQEENQCLTKADDDLMHLQRLIRMRDKELTGLQKRIVELCSNEDKLRHQLKEKSEDAEKSDHRFHATNQQLAKLQNRFAEKQREADGKSELLKRAEGMLAELQNLLMKKDREADEKGEPEKDGRDAGGTSKPVDEERERSRRKERTREKEGADAGGTSAPVDEENSESTHKRPENFKGSLI
jgi:chromosome segregation ATPase